MKGIEPSYSAWKAAALPLSYTRLIYLEKTRSTCPISLPPRHPFANGRYRIRTCVTEVTDLQSVPFNHSGNLPDLSFFVAISAKTPTVTCRRSYRSQRRDLNPRPADYKSAALPLSYAGPLFQSPTLPGNAIVYRPTILPQGEFAPLQPVLSLNFIYLPQLQTPSLPPMFSSNLETLPANVPKIQDRARSVPLQPNHARSKLRKNSVLPRTRGRRCERRFTVFGRFSCRIRPIASNPELESGKKWGGKKSQNCQFRGPFQVFIKLKRENEAPADQVSAYLTNFTVMVNMNWWC